MPFIGPSAQDPGWWQQVWTVDLRQKSETKPRKIEFEVLSEFGFTSQPGETGADGTPYWRSSAVQHRVPRGMNTDLATVPSFLWGVVASYGRQTLPAILHDMLCYASQLPGQPAAFRRRSRREADALFRETLRDSGSGVVRRWLMWTGVRLGGRLLVSAALALLLVLVLLLFLLGSPTPLAAAAGVAFALLVALMALASREADRLPRPARGVRPNASSEEFGPARFDGAAFASLAGAVVLATLAAPLLVPVTLVTVATQTVLRIGERRLPPGFTGTPDAATGLIPEGACARIEWVPMQPATDRSHQAPLPAGPH